MSYSVLVDVVIELVDEVVRTVSVAPTSVGTRGSEGVFDALLATISIDVSACTNTFAASTSFNEASSNLFSCK